MPDLGCPCTREASRVLTLRTLPFFAHGDATLRFLGGGRPSSRATRPALVFFSVGVPPPTAFPCRFAGKPLVSPVGEAGCVGDAKVQI
jgi:hypothetical protein